MVYIKLISLFMVLIGSLFFYLVSDHDYILTLLIALSVLNLLVIYVKRLDLRSPFVVFYLFYILFYLLGPSFSLIYFGDSFIAFNYGNTFANEISLGSLQKTYNFMLIFGLVLLIYFCFFCSNISVNIADANYTLMYSLYLVISALALIFVFSDYLSLKSNYSAIYISGNANILKSFILNLFKFLSFVLLMNITSKKFRYVAAIFIFFSFIDSLKGARVLFILPLIMVFVVYNIRFRKKESINYLGFMLGFIVLFFTSVLWQIYRSGDLDSFTLLLSQSLSRGSYILALSIENNSYLSRQDSFLLSPLLYIYKYFQYGSSIVGQSESSAIIRGDLNHTLSYYLNKSAYLNGAGLGSASLAEFAQYGYLYFLFTSTSFVIFYHYLFKLSIKNKYLYNCLPIFILHFIFTPRDYAFPILNGVFKYSLFLFLFAIIIQLARSTKRRDDAFIS